MALIERLSRESMQPVITGAFQGQQQIRSNTARFIPPADNRAVSLPSEPF